jgi:nitrate reductase gamma subunit
MHLPYIALEIFAIGFIVALKFGHAKALVSEVLPHTRENDFSFYCIRWGIFPILGIFIVATILPGIITWWIAHYARLILLQVVLMALALTAAVSAFQMAFNYVKCSECKMQRSWWNALFLVLLGAHLLASITMNFLYGWEISWFTTLAAPYLWSVLTFEPNLTLIESLPALLQFYLVQGCFVFAVAPFFAISWVVFNPKARCLKRQKAN